MSTLGAKRLALGGVLSLAGCALAPPAEPDLVAQGTYRLESDSLGERCRLATDVREKGGRLVVTGTWISAPHCRLGSLPVVEVVDQGGTVIARRTAALEKSSHVGTLSHPPRTHPPPRHTHEVITAEFDPVPPPASVIRIRLTGAEPPRAGPEDEDG
jgi:hypothetical protein